MRERRAAIADGIEVEEARSANALRHEVRYRIPVCASQPAAIRLRPGARLLISIFTSVHHCTKCSGCHLSHVGVSFDPVAKLQRCSGAKHSKRRRCGSHGDRSAVRSRHAKVGIPQSRRHDSALALGMCQLPSSTRKPGSSSLQCSSTINVMLIPAFVLQLHGCVAIRSVRQGDLSAEHGKASRTGLCHYLQTPTFR